MNSRIATRMLWKDYRTLRSFWLSLVFGTVLVQLLWAWNESVLQNRRIDPAALGVLGLVFAGLYAIGCGAALFAYEHEDRTRWWLQQLPLHNSEVFWPKVTWGFVSSLVLAAVVTLTGLAIGFWYGDSSYADFRSEVGLSAETIAFVLIVVVGILEVCAWASFWSLITRRTLLGAVLTLPSAVLAALIIWHVIALCLWGHSLHQPPTGQRSLQVIYWSAVCHGVVAVILMLLNRRLVTSWLIDSPSGAGTRVPFTGIIIEREAGSSRDQSGRDVPRVLGNLLWLHWRQTRVMSCVLLVLSLLGPLFLTAAIALGDGLPEAVRVLASVPFAAVILACYALPTLIGVTAFYADQQGAAFRFLTQRGADPGLVWTSRQLAGVALLAACALVSLFFLIPLLMLSNVVRLNDPEVWLLVYAGLLGIPLAYAAGQFGSLFFRSTLVGTFVGVLITLVLWGWMAFTWNLRIPWWWSVLPLGIALLVATRRRTAAWLTESLSVWDWLRPAALPVLVWLVILVGIAFYRVYEVPYTALDLSWGEVTQGLDEAVALKTAEQYRAAATALNSPSPSEPPGDSDDSSETTAGAAWPYRPLPPTDAERQWVAENAKVLDQFRVAANRPTCLFHPFGEDIYDQRGDVDQLRPLAELMFADSRVQIAKGDLALAWQDYAELLRFANHLRNLGTFLEWQLGQELERQVYDSVVGWAGHEGQTVELLTSAMTQLVGVPAERPPIVNNIGRHHWEVLQSFNEAIQESSAAKGWQSWALRYLPTERARARRFSRLAMEVNLTEAQMIEPPRPFDGPQENRRLQAKLEQFGQRTDVVAYAITNTWDDYQNLHGKTENQRRALVVALLLARHELVTGELPERLDEIPADANIRVPVDWYTGRPFVYLRQGVAVELSVEFGDAYFRRLRRSYPPETPLLWSAAYSGSTVEVQIRELLKSLNDASDDLDGTLSPSSFDQEEQVSRPDEEESDSGGYGIGAEATTDGVYGFDGMGYGEDGVEFGMGTPLTAEEQLKFLRADATEWEKGIVYPVPIRDAANEPE